MDRDQTTDTDDPFPDRGRRFWADALAAVAPRVDKAAIWIVAGLLTADDGADALLVVSDALDEYATELVLDDRLAEAGEVSAIGGVLRDRVQTDRELYRPADAAVEPADVSLGTCCICGGVCDEGAGIAMLPFKGTVPGHGWGCFVCGLPLDGASAAICGDCLPGFLTGEKRLVYACAGYPATDGRVAIEDLTEPHLHDPDVAH